MSMDRKNKFKAAILGSLAGCVLLAPGPAMAQPRDEVVIAQTKTFSVPAQAAGDAIPLFAKQAGIQILANGDTVRGRRTNAVEGTYTPDRGLSLLLAGTGFDAVAQTPRVPRALLASVAAGCVAFLISETADWAVYTFSGRPLSQRILISSCISAPIDQALFLYLASQVVPGMFAWGTPVRPPPKRPSRNFLARSRARG